MKKTTQSDLSDEHHTHHDEVAILLEPRRVWNGEVSRSIDQHETLALVSDNGHAKVILGIHLDLVRETTVGGISDLFLTHRPNTYVSGIGREHLEVELHATEGIGLLLVRNTIHGHLVGNSHRKGLLLLYLVGNGVNEREEHRISGIHRNVVDFHVSDLHLLHLAGRQLLALNLPRTGEEALHGEFEVFRGRADGNSDDKQRKKRKGSHL